MSIRLTRSERKTLLEILRVALHNRDTIESFVTDSSLSHILCDEVIYEPRGKALRSLIDAASKLNYGVATILEELSEILDREDLRRLAQAFRTREGKRALLDFWTFTEQGSSAVDRSELTAEVLLLILSMPVPIAIDWLFFQANLPSPWEKTARLTLISSVGICVLWGCYRISRGVKLVDRTVFIAIGLILGMVISYAFPVY